jgi:hypothetical protein
MKWKKCIFDRSVLVLYGPSWGLMPYSHQISDLQRGIIGGLHFSLLRGDFCGLIGSPSCLFRIGSWKSRFSSRQA